MTHDFGVRSRRRGPPIGAVAIVSVVLLLGGTFTFSFLRHRTMAITDAREWTITGAPCPRLSREAFQSAGLQAPQGLLYGDVLFRRRFGHMSCAAIVYDGGRGFGSYPVCQFTSPAVLVAKTGKEEAYFNPGIGRLATISVPHGRPQCVMNSKFVVSLGSGAPGAR